MANEQVKQKKQGKAEVSPQPKGEGQPAITGQEHWNKCAQLVAQVWADEHLKQRLMDNPAAVLREHGIEVPAGVEVRVVEPTEKLLYFLLPPKPADVTELTSSQLTGVAGGVAGKCDVIAVNPITGEKVTVIEYGKIDLSGAGSCAACAFY